MSDPAVDPKTITPSHALGLSTQVYEQLHRIAVNRLAGQPAGHTLQATALVHEAYLKIQAVPALSAIDRAHYFRLAAEAMRQVLVDHARSKGRQKRGGGGGDGGGRVRRAMSDVAQLAAEQDPDEILALEEAVRRFEGEQPRAAEIVKLRFYARRRTAAPASVLADFNPIAMIWSKVERLLRSDAARMG